MSGRKRTDTKNVYKEDLEVVESGSMEKRGKDGGRIVVGCGEE